MKKFLFLLLPTLIFLLSCDTRTEHSPEKEEMFTLRFGAMDDGLGNRVCAVMSDGFFIISDTGRQKLMKFNSYGDLTDLYYNSSKSRPVILNGKPGKISPVSSGKEFPFISPTHTATDKKQNIYVADKLPEHMHQKSSLFDTVLAYTVHCFDAAGNYTGKLGPEGPGADPFPMITKLEINNSGHLIVHALVPEGKIIYWFSENMTPLYKLIFSPGDFMTDETDPQLIASPDTVSASADGYFLYIKVDFYRRTMGENDIDFHKSSVFTYDMAQRGFTGSIDIPHTYMAAENGGKSISIDRLETIYQLLGVHGSDILFLASPVSSTRYNILILSADGNIIANTYIDCGINREYFSDISLNTEGIISALIKDEEKVHAVWWRSDRLLPDFRKSLPSPF